MEFPERQVQLDTASGGERGTPLSVHDHSANLKDVNPDGEYYDLRSCLPPWLSAYGSGLLCGYSAYAMGPPRELGDGEGLRVAGRMGVISVGAWHLVGVGSTARRPFGFERVLGDGLWLVSIAPVVAGGQWFWW